MTSPSRIWNGQTYCIVGIFHRKFSLNFAVDWTSKYHSTETRSLIDCDHIHESCCENLIWELHWLSNSFLLWQTFMSSAIWYNNIIICLLPFLYYIRCIITQYFHKEGNWFNLYSIRLKHSYQRCQTLLFFFNWFTYRICSW